MENNTSNNENSENNTPVNDSDHGTQGCMIFAFFVFIIVCGIVTYFYLGEWGIDPEHKLRNTIFITIFLSGFTWGFIANIENNENNDNRNIISIFGESTATGVVVGVLMCLFALIPYFFILVIDWSNDPGRFADRDYEELNKETYLKYTNLCSKKEGINRHACNFRVSTNYPSCFQKHIRNETKVEIFTGYIDRLRIDTENLTKCLDQPSKSTFWDDLVREAQSCTTESCANDINTRLECVNSSTQYYIELITLNNSFTPQDAKAGFKNKYSVDSRVNIRIPKPDLKILEKCLMNNYVNNPNI